MNDKAAAKDAISQHLGEWVERKFGIEQIRYIAVRGAENDIEGLALNDCQILYTLYREDIWYALSVEAKAAGIGLWQYVARLKGAGVLRDAQRIEAMLVWAAVELISREIVDDRRRKR